MESWEQSQDLQAEEKPPDEIPWSKSRSFRLRFLP
jgi:hypothetical protein